jgi:prephenate dehydrogenase
MIGAMRIAIVGFGLIGGSIARALRRPEALAGGEHVVAAWSRSPEGPRAAVAVGIVDVAPDDLASAVEGAELVVLAAPPLACLDILDELGGALRAVVAPEATVTDTASTKRALVERGDRNGLRFVGGHPMAGRESRGFAASVADLFVDRPWVVCPGAGAEDADTARVVALATACGARPIRLDPDRHDALVAAISHVPLILSVALAESVLGRADAAEALALAAGGWRGMTRLAEGDPEMSAGIAATNGPQTASGLRTLRAGLADWISALDDPGADTAALEKRFAAIRERLVGR